MKVQERSYKDKKVFVGIDVHKEKQVVVAISGGVVCKRWTTNECPKTLASQIKRYFPEAEIHNAYEAGFSGFKLHRHLADQGIRSRVINPASIEIRSNDRVKTDKRDARKIAEQIEAGKLRAIYVPTEAEEEKRSLSRGREQAVERRKRIGNQLKMKLHYLGVALPEGMKMGERFLKWTLKLDLASGHRFLIRELVGAWREEAARVKRFEKELEKQAEADPRENIYRSVPGVGSISSRVLSNELGDMSRFDNERQLFSATGLTPGEYSSGDKVRKGHISRQGSSRIRGLLIEVAWRAIKEDRVLFDIYLRLKHQREGKRAIVAVARKMLGRMRKCLVDKVKWEERPEMARVS